jgi:hypothetical protein
MHDLNPIKDQRRQRPAKPHFQPGTGRPTGRSETNAQPLSDRHDANGVVLRSAGSGNGTMTIENGTDHDAAVSLSQRVGR